MWFRYCYIFQTLMNASLHHPFVTWTRSATIPLALTPVLASLDTLVTTKLVQVRNFGRIMSWKEIKMSYVLEKADWEGDLMKYVIHDILIFIHMFIIIIILPSLIPLFFLLLVRLLAIGVLQNLLIPFLQTLTNAQNRQTTVVCILSASILRVLLGAVQLQKRKLSG